MLSAPRGPRQPMHKVTIHNVNAVRDRQAWLTLRQGYLTATDWPKITGSSRWGDAYGVIADKTLPLEGPGFEPSLPMRVGTGLEPLIIRHIQDEWGEGEDYSQLFITRKHMGFTPDFLLWQENRWQLAEIKVSIRDWGGCVPEDYLDQIRFQATVLGIGEVHVVHLKLASWGEGLKMMHNRSVPIERLKIYEVLVSATQRRLIANQSARWWNANVG